jgi:hypothetical protein
MLYEYAVEPCAIASNWQTCRYLSEKFGFDRARLLSLYPKKWLTLAIEAAEGLPDVEKKTVTERLIKLKRDASIKSGRNYDPALNDWLRNAILQQTVAPFRAIVASSNPSAHAFVLKADEIEEASPLMAAPHDFEVKRVAKDIAAAMSLFLASANTILFVDAYYDPFNAKYQNTMRECLKIVHAENQQAVCEVHHLDHARCPPAAAIEREARNKFGGVIPDGMTITIYRWRQKQGGEDFHARYLLTDRGGIRVDAGFSAEGGSENTDMSLMDIALSQVKRSALDRAATVYELVEPVLRIEPTGRVEHI